MKLQLTFRPHGTVVVILVNGEVRGTINWQAAKEDAIALKKLAQEAQAGQHGGVVSFALHSKPALPLTLHPDYAFQFARGLHAAGAKAEEMEPAVIERLVQEGALLARLGNPFGLTDNSKMQDDIWNAAQWDSAARRAVPSVQGQRVKVQLGVPTITVSPPKGLQ